VIWLDDIDRLIGAGGITDGALRRLAAGRNIIVGTIRARAYDRFRPSDQLRLPEWDVLSVFEHVFISRDLTQTEQERLARAVDDPDIRDRIRTVGLGEYVGAAAQVTEALKLGAAGTDPLGYALVLAAADWRRCGMTRPMPSSMLVPLAEPHLDQRGQARLADPDAFNTGLAWATHDINPNVALLQPGGPDSYIVYDYALDLISAQDTPIPGSSWAVIMATADPPELIRLGYAARVTYHRSETAAQAWRKAASSGHADAVPQAAFNLSVVSRSATRRRRLIGNTLYIRMLPQGRIFVNLTPKASDPIKLAQNDTVLEKFDGAIFPMSVTTAVSLARKYGAKLCPLTGASSDADTDWHLEKREEEPVYSRDDDFEPWMEGSNTLEYSYTIYRYYFICKRCHLQEMVTLTSSTGAPEQDAIVVHTMNTQAVTGHIGFDESLNELMCTESQDEDLMIVVGGVFLQATPEYARRHWPEHRVVFQGPMYQRGQAGQTNSGDYLILKRDLRS
jgi:hypothetical protein